MNIRKLEIKYAIEYYNFLLDIFNEYDKINLLKKNKKGMRKSKK